MKTARRSFLFNGPAGLLACGNLPQMLLAQASGASAPVANDVLDFWTNRVGVPADLVLREQAKQGSTSSRAGFSMQGQGLQAYGREPLFLYVDTEQNRIVPAQEIPSQKLLPPGDAAVELRLGRLRLNSNDEGRFEKFAAGGIYLDVQQKHTPAEAASAMAWSVFGAVFPRQRAKLVKGRPAPAASAPQEPGGVQAIALQGGAGKVMLSAFMKDAKRSAFGSFVNTFLELTGKPTEFLPMLGLSAIAAPALTAIRALVCNLQAHGGSHDWLFQNSPVDLACTADSAEASGGIRLRSGNYLVIPKSHASALKGSIEDVKVVDGFLVPKAAGMLDVFDAAPATAEGVSYLSMNVSVRRAKLGGCSLLPLPR